MFFYIITKE